MQWKFQLRGKEATLIRVEHVAAVRPTAQARSQAASRSQLVRTFGTMAIDTARGGRFGVDLPSRNRELFERAGWLFVEPRDNVTRAAEVTRRSVQNAAAVAQVFLDRSGNFQIASDLITVQVSPELSDNQALQRLQADKLAVVRRLTFAPNTFEVRVMVERRLPDLIRELQQRPYYIFAEPMLIQPITGRQVVPTDPRYGDQWHHSNNGGNGGTPGADICSQQAWALTRGRGPDRPVSIAVIDNGMQVSHPDLKVGIVGGGFFQSTAEGSANLVRFTPGMSGFPDNPHGTFCMGMAGARMNNKKGGCGAAPEADLLAIACLDDQIGTQATLARALAYAADPSKEDSQATVADGADVIACSLGPNGADWDLTSVLDLAIRFAAREGRGGRGIPIFWAASNGYVEISRDEIASHPNVIAVGRSNRNDLADGTAYGPKLQFLAPGADVFSTTSSSKYGFDTGTSFAAPLAAGVAALVLARHPKWSARQVRTRLRKTCDKVGGVNYDSKGHHDEYGYGRINASLAAV
jgi:thermitase